MHQFKSNSFIIDNLSSFKWLRASNLGYQSSKVEDLEREKTKKKRIEKRKKKPKERERKKKKMKEKKEKEKKGPK